MEEIDLAYQDWLKNGTTMTADGLFEFLKKRYTLVKKDTGPTDELFLSVVAGYRGCCKECGEGFDNEKSWRYNTECELCGEPIPEHLIIKKDE